MKRLEKVKKQYTVYIDLILEDLIPGYLEKRRKDLFKIKEALDSKDFETIRIIAHNMKGNGAGYGFEQITAIGSEMEMAAKKENLVLIQNNLDRLTDFLNHLVVVFYEEE